LEPLLPNAGTSFKNPFTNTQGVGVAFADVATFARPLPPPAVSGIVAYSDSVTLTYVIAGRGKDLAVANGLTLQLTSGQ
jgi:hypothetical protein